MAKVLLFPVGRMFEAAMAYMDSDAVFTFPNLMDTISTDDILLTVADVMDGKGDTPNLVPDFMDMAFFAWQKSGMFTTDLKMDIVIAAKAMMTIFVHEMMHRQNKLIVDRTTYSLEPNAIISTQEV
jgi:hypothetical protein